MLVFLLFFLSASLAIPLNTNHTFSKREIHAGDSFTEVINGVKRTCYWEGTSPICNGACPGLFDEVDRRPRNYIPYSPCFPWDSGCHTDPYFGQPCWGWVGKAKCCLRIQIPRDQ